MGQFLNSINEVRKNYNKYDAWEQAQADERAKKEYLANTLDIPKDKVDLTSAKAKAVIRATEIMDKRSEDNCENMEQLTGLIAIPPIFIASAGIPAGFQKYTNSVIKNIQKDIQTLNNQISKSDITQETLKQLNNKKQFLIKKMNNLSRKSGIYGQLLSVPVLLALGAYITLWSTAKQKEASRIGRYQAKQDELKDIKNFVIYTPEQIKQAEEIADKIPDEKERNSFTKLISELKALKKDKKAYKEWLKEKDPDEIEKLKAMNFTPEQLKLGNEDKELIVDAVKEINIMAEEYSENVENAYDTLGTVSWLIAAPAGFLINKILKLCKTPTMINRAISIAIPTITSISLSIAGTLEQKKASRIGRYLARQDLMKNPARLMAYSEEEMQQAENIKAENQKKSFFEELVGSFSFLVKYSKDTKAYNKYKKTEQSQIEKIQKAFNQIEISDKQKKDAEKLQENVFRAFDEIDEMSQRFSEDIEAGTDIAKQVMGNLWTIGSSLALLSGITAFLKGTFPISKIANSIVNIGFKEDSEFKGKINNLYNILKEDKQLKHEFQRAIATGNLKYFLTKPKAEKINKAITDIMLYLSPKENLGEAELPTEMLKKELKDGVIAKWVRNLINETAKVLTLKKINSQIDEFGQLQPEVTNELKELKQTLKLTGWRNYKTIIGTGATAGLPLLSIIIGVPYAFNAWLTNIQKKAGKIGIMKAMNKIDDPRIFAPTEPAISIHTPEQTENTQTSLLQKFRTN